MNDMMLFNEIIGHLGLLELPLKGRTFTWSNMQQVPLLQQLDWFFTISSWITTYPNTMVHDMSRPTSDHVPCVVHIDTFIPKVNLFRFENFWVDQPGLFECVKLVWDKPTKSFSSAAILVEKLKLLRFELKKWRKSLAKLKLLIRRFDVVIFFLIN